MTKNKNKTLLYIAILTVIVAVVWVLVSAVSHFRQPTIPKDIEAVSAPLDPTIDLDLFKKLQGRSL